MRRLVHLLICVVLTFSSMVVLSADDGPFFPPDPFEDDQGFCGCGAGSCCR